MSGAARLVVIALVGVSLTLIARAQKPEYALPIGAATAVCLFITALTAFTDVTNALGELMARYSTLSQALGLMLKVLGIGFLTQFGVQLAKDAGASAIALQLELGGRVLIVVCVLPSAIALIELGASLLKTL